MKKNADWIELRTRVKRFVEQRVIPVEKDLYECDRARRKSMMSGLMDQAKAEGLWAIGHPVELGGHGMPFLDYVHVNEVIGQSFFAMQALGTLSLQDSLMLNRHASKACRELYLKPLVNGDKVPSIGMTEPDVASSDPTQIETTAVLENGRWTINGRKWFTTGAADADYTTVMCRNRSGRAAPSAIQPDHRPHRQSRLSHRARNPGAGYRRRTLRNRTEGRESARGQPRRDTVAAGSGLPRSGWVPAGSSTACAGWARPSAPST